MKARKTGKKQSESFLEMATGWRDKYRPGDPKDKKNQYAHVDRKKQRD